MDDGMRRYGMRKEIEELRIATKKAVMDATDLYDDANKIANYVSNRVISEVLGNFRTESDFNELVRYLRCELQSETNLEVQHEKDI